MSTKFCDWQEREKGKCCHSSSLNNYFFKRFFWCGLFLKSLLNLSQYCFWFMFSWVGFFGFFFFFGQEACEILGLWSGMEPLHWRAKSYPLDSQWSPKNLFFKDKYLALTDFWNMDVLLDKNLTWANWERQTIWDLSARTWNKRASLFHKGKKIFLWLISISAHFLFIIPAINHQAVFNEHLWGS